MSGDPIRWRTDYDLAVKEAQRTHRLLVVHFASANRPICKVMEEETLSNPEALRFAQAHFLEVKLDADERADLFERLTGERGALATCVVDPSEDVVSILSGFATADRYVDFLGRADKGYPRLALLRGEARRRATDPVSALRLGEAYEALGSSRRADQSFRSVIALSQVGEHVGPEAMAALFSARERLARSLVARGRSTDARNELEEARKLDPQAQIKSADRFLLTEALLLSLERNLREAVSRLTDHLQRFPASPERPQALFALGSIQHELRDDPSALSSLELVLRDHPGSRWAELARGQIEHIRNPQPDHQH